MAMRKEYCIGEFIRIIQNKKEGREGELFKRDGGGEICLWFHILQPEIPVFRKTAQNTGVIYFYNLCN